MCFIELLEKMIRGILFAEINKEYGITENQIIGVLVGFYRDGNEVNMEGVGYKLYSRAWVFLHPLICAFKKIKMKAGKVKRLWHSK